MIEVVVPSFLGLAKMDLGKGNFYARYCFPAFTEVQLPETVSYSENFTYCRAQLDRPPGFVAAMAGESDSLASLS